MKRWALFTILLVVLASCGGFKTHNDLIGERYTAVVLEKVAFFDGPSLESKAFFLDRPEEFVIEEVECGEGKKDVICPYERDEFGDPKNFDKIFYKVKFESGKTGYLHAAYIFYSQLSKYLLSPLGYMYFGNTFEIKTDYNTMWQVVINSIDDLGYVIAQMRKEEGYIATQLKDMRTYRSKLSVWISKKGDYIEVTVKAKSEQLEENKSDKRDIPYWRETSGSLYQKNFLDEVRKRFVRLQKSERR